MIQPYFAELSAEFENIRFLYADIDRHAKDFRDISKVPTFRLYHHGQLAAEMSGADVENLVGALSQLSSQ
jgi:hypothetical protein